MRTRTAVLLASLLLAACSVQQREENKQPAPAMRVSGGGFSEAVPVRKGQSSRAARPYLEGNVAATEENITVPEGTPYLPDNPEATKLCTQEPTPDAMGTAAFPIKDRYAHLPTLGQFFTAWSCGLRRVRELPTVTGDEYMAPVHVTLASPPTGDFESALFMAGFTCEKETKGKGCIEWTMAENVRLDLLARLGKFADQIQKD